MASNCPSVGAMTVTKTTLCANVSIIRYQVCLVSMVSGVDIRVASVCSSVGAMTVTKTTLCANVSVIRHQVCLISMVLYLSKSHVSDIWSRQCHVIHVHTL